MTSSADPARTVVVIGAATSVGRATAEHFVASGDRVYACDVLEEPLVTLRSGGARTARVDATNPSQMECFLRDAIDATGSVDVLVNTVGLPGPRAPIEAVDVAEWEQTLRGSVGAAFHAIRVAAPAMKAKRSGAIVNFSSASTRSGLPLRTPYVVAKAAVEALTRNLARELGPYNVRINAILPGAIDNERLSGIVAARAAATSRTPAQVEAEMLRYVAMRSKIAIAELVNMIAFLTSSRAPHVTGQLIAVDGFVEWEE